MHYGRTWCVPRASASLLSLHAIAPSPPRRRACRKLMATSTPAFAGLLTTESDGYIAQGER